MAHKHANLHLNRIGQIAVVVQDIERAIGFYRDTLGMTMLFQAGTIAFFDCGGVRLMLDRPSSDEFDHPGSILYFPVDDLHESHAALEERGTEIVAEPHLIARMPDHELWMAFYHDTEGNTFALMSKVRQPA
jgi:methylmalonyl-CoA/ethylmalonyl-CoA epimerase